MKRSSLFLAAALTAATGLNVVLWSAFVDSSGNASRLHGELVDTRARLRQAQLDVVTLWPDQPAKGAFAPHPYLGTRVDPALEVSGG